MNPQDVLLVIVLCVLFGGVAGVLSVRWQRRAVTVSIAQHADSFIQTPGVLILASRVIEQIKSARFTEITIQEISHHAQQAGVSWHDPAQWPRDSETDQKLIVLAGRADRVQAVLSELQSAMDRDATYISIEQMETIQRIVDIAQEYILRAQDALNRGGLEYEDVGFLMQDAGPSKDKINQSLTVLSMQLIISSTKNEVIHEQASEVVNRTLKK
ncbi:MAG: hypothetical protein AB8C13_03280 [Phycisphaerales bacterium]